jgi:TolB-like protein/Flp pilus assembly protein TadD
VIGLGSWATETHVKRFRREAEAAASLNHPCIVPIYEVGERDGACYFSMGLVEGEQLDVILKRQPMPIRRAVEVIAKVARTVHYAHEHGILHRDIKPGNILLDGNGEPHLTDFGLARLVEAESTVTGTLEVFGTPSYMAPEQAAGETTKLGKVTDVYGLGAVFYQLLTGQPPFAGGTTYETIRLLRETEPRSPRLLNPKINRDLSTICLKCLEKDPQRRYSSALALAEDLERWLKHEPIQAKPSGVFTHTRKWVQRNPSTAVLVTLLVALAIGLSVTVWNRKPEVVIPKSVAVLPFQDLSEDPNNAYFAEGIQEEILTRLAKIADLKVISRTSTSHYKSKPDDIGEIAKQLSVANVLEGSVQKTAGQVRVSVELINAQTDSHLWADTYDRKLTDILGVESEIAKRIAESLHAKLSGPEEQALAVKPTNNPEAYDAYLRGLAFDIYSQATIYGFSRALGWQAAGFYERAVQLDPRFAIAWARLSRADAHLYFNSTESAATARGDAAKHALENAQKLEPDSPETLLALGYYQYHVLHDYGPAKTTFGRVGKMLRGSSEVPWALGAVTRREGHWDQSVAYYEQALTLDPRNIDFLMDAAWTYSMLRRFPDALRLYDRALDITPNSLDIMAAKAGSYQAQGNLQEAAKLLSGINEQIPSANALEVKTTQLRLERNYGEAIRLLQALLAKFHFDSQFEKAGTQLTLAFLQRIAGDTAGAKATAEEARSALEQLYRDQPNNWRFAENLSRLYAMIGDKDSAFNEARRAIMLLPRAKDPVIGPGLEENLAFIQMIFADKSHAISTLTRLLQTPYDSRFYTTTSTPALLRLDPLWDPLRSDPAFQKLCEERIDKSIAVLPFQNLSDEKDSAYFAEGVQEEILTRLASVADLKVISRTSTQQYENKPRDLAEIAKQLGVANILEGSAQKVAQQVRINVQLINAQTGSHLWADSYDRKLTDMLEVESEIAKRIAESLQAKLTGREEKTLGAKLTNNPEAYDAYLRGLALTARSVFSHENDVLTKARSFYERAVQLDPRFAIAWARLSRADALLYFNDPASATSDAAKQALDNAQKLEPESPETLLAQGYYQYWVLRNYELAKTMFARVGEMLPTSSEAPYALGLITRREGNWDQSIAYFEQALTVDPRNPLLLRDAAETYSMFRRFPMALKLSDRELDITPNDPDAIATKARIYQAEGNLQQASRLLSEVSWQTPSGLLFYNKINQLRLERNYAEVIRLLQARQAQFHYASEVENRDERVWVALTQRLVGDVAGAKVTAKQTSNTLETLYTNQPDNWNLAYLLSQVYAAMGEKDSALKVAERAVMVLPRGKDAVSGPALEENLAVIVTMFGDNDRAITTLGPLLDKPYGPFGYALPPITPALLRLDPLWDPLRADPAFQKLCEGKRP